MYLFTISGYADNSVGQGLLPGIPKPMLANTTVRQLQHGSRLVLETTSGERIMTFLANDFVQVPATVEHQSSLEALPIVPIVDPSFGMHDLPVGTKVYLAD